MSERYLVTPALVYANGPIHLGHMVEHIQVNVFVRALRMAGRDVLYVCGADAHGTPIEINAKKSGIPPSEFVEKWRLAHSLTFEQFGITFDGGYGSTHTPENERHAQEVFKRLKAKGHIAVREVEQLFDDHEKRFLPDRLVRGTCPKCKTTDQYGDSCESCGSTYRPTELIDPKSALSNTTPILKSSEHYFFELNKYAERLELWTAAPGVLQEEVKKSLVNWLKEGLKDWDISRDGPYFGFKIPGEENKYFYVWLDAPIGYISLAEKAAADLGRKFEDYWLSEDARIIHFIGKDIVYFHTLFWPAMLMGAGYHLPYSVCVHGMLTVNGEKMSKSRGTFILADTFATHVAPHMFRYYIASKLTPKIEDIDLNLEEFADRVNSGLVNKVVNVVSRAIPLLHRFCGGKIGEIDQSAEALIAKCAQVANNSFDLYYARDTAQAVKEILELAEEANKYLQDQAPWKLAQSDPDKARSILTTGIWSGKICIGLLKPILPEIAQTMEQILQIEELTFANIMDQLPVGSLINEYKHLVERVEAEKLTDVLHNSAPEKKPVPANKEETKEIDFPTFARVDMRAALVIAAENVEGSDKLISVLLNVGELGERRILSGLRPHVMPESLVGKTVLIVANLAPRKMRFGISEGMILASGNNPPRPIFLEGSHPGDKIS